MDHDVDLSAVGPDLLESLADGLPVGHADPLVDVPFADEPVEVLVRGAAGDGGGGADGDGLPGERGAEATVPGGDEDVLPGKMNRGEEWRIITWRDSEGQEQRESSRDESGREIDFGCKNNL